MDAELRRRGFYSDGVKETIAHDWDRHLSAEKQYHEICLESSWKYRRSDLTTANSLKLYTSFFSPDHLNPPDLPVLLGETHWPNDRKTKPGHVNLEDRGSEFVSKAANKGIPIASHKQLAKARSPPLFHQFERKQSVPAGFEMINEDMFSRKDNKFMVFNSAGVSSWTGTTPITKISGIEKMLEGTLQ
jgi:hypothetical protein